MPWPCRAQGSIRASSSSGGTGTAEVTPGSRSASRSRRPSRVRPGRRHRSKAGSPSPAWCAQDVEAQRVVGHRHRERQHREVDQRPMVHGRKRPAAVCSSGRSKRRRFIPCPPHSAAVSAAGAGIGPLTPPSAVRRTGWGWRSTRSSLWVASDHRRAQLAQLGEQVHQPAGELAVEVAGGLVASSRLGRMMTARATAINCRWPIDRLGGLASMAPDRPSQASISEDEAADLVVRGAVDPERQGDIVEADRWSSSRTSWNTMPIRRRDALRSSRLRLADVAPEQGELGRARASAAAEQAQQRGLAGAGRPHQEHELAASQPAGSDRAGPRGRHRSAWQRCRAGAWCRTVVP